jgi:flagellar hook protein FlgE
MSSQTGLSGLNAAASNLDIIGNNISNANTVGYKKARAEFADLIASAVGAGSGSAQGIGVSIATVSQQFTQGGINVTGNGLDVALNGAGFFQVTLADGTTAYSRDGQLKLDKTGALVNNAGSSIMGFPTDAAGSTTSSNPVPLKIPTGAPIPAKNTSNVTAQFNLDARADIAANVYPPKSISSYGTTLNAFDAQGLEVPVTLAFVRVGPNPSANPPIDVDTWDVYDQNTITAGQGIINADAVVGSVNKANFELNKKNTALNLQNGNDDLPTYTNPGLVGTVIPAPEALPSDSLSPTAPATVSTGALFRIQFDSAGNLIPLTTDPVIEVRSTNNPALSPISVSLGLGGTTQYGTAFSVLKLEQDGYTAGNVTSVGISDTGKITAKYSNGQSIVYGQLALSDFRNVQGLAQIGNGNWKETLQSGPPLVGAPGEAQFGNVRPGALEESNVDLTAELVDMMTAQRSYQANAQTIKTQDQALQTLVNLR